MADDATAVGANPVVFFDLTLGGEPVSYFREQSSLCCVCLYMYQQIVASRQNVK